MSERSELTELAQHFSDINDQPRLEQVLMKLEGLPADSPSPVQPDTSGSVMERNENKNYDVKTTPREFALESVKRSLQNNATVMGLFTDLGLTALKQVVPLAADKFGGGLTDPFRNTKRMGEITGQALDSDPSMLPPDDESRFTGTGIEMAGSSILPSGLVIGASKKPVTAAITEAASIGGASVGAEVGGSVSEEGRLGRAPGEAVGAMSGASPAVATVAAVKGIIKGKKAAGTTLSNKAGKRIKGIVKAEGLEKKIEESNEIVEAVRKVTGKEMKPTLSGRTQSEILGDVEQKVLGVDVPTSERAIAQHKENSEIVGDFVNKTLAAPKGKSLQGIAGNELRKRTLSIKEAARGVAAQRALLSKRTGGDDIGKQQPIGGELRATRDLNKQRESTKLTDRLEGEGGIYEQAAKEGIAIDINRVSKFVNNMAGSDREFFQNMPAVFKQVSDAKKQKPSFKLLHSLWRKTNEELSMALRTGSPKTEQLRALKKQLGKQVDAFEETGSKAATEFRKWNEDYSKYSEAFKESVGGKLGAGNRFGERLSDEEIVKNFFTPSGLDNFNKVYGKNPYARQRLEDGILDLFAKESGMTKGEFKPDTFLAKHAEELKKVPELRKKLYSSKKVAEALLDKNSRLMDAEKQISKGILGQLANAADVDKVIDKALTDPKYMRQLMTTGKEGRQAVAHALTTGIPRAAFAKKMTIGKYMDENEKTLRPILSHYGKDHYNNIRTAMRATDMVLSGQPPKHPNLTFLNQDPLDAMIGSSFPSLLSQARATYITRQSSPVYMASLSMSRLWMRTAGKNSQRLQEYLLTNPKAARDFALATKSQKIGVMATKINHHLLSSGVRAVTSASGELLRNDK